MIPGWKLRILLVFPSPGLCCKYGENIVKDENIQDKLFCILPRL